MQSNVRFDCVFQLEIHTSFYTTNIKPDEFKYVFCFNASWWACINKIILGCQFNSYMYKYIYSTVYVTIKKEY